MAQPGALEREVGGRPAAGPERASFGAAVVRFVSRVFTYPAPERYRGCHQLLPRVERCG